MRSNWFWALAILAVSTWGLAGCAGHAPAAEVETVGTLAAGPSVYSAPLKHDAPPALGFVAGSDDENPGDAFTTETRVEAPDVAAKDGGLVVGAVR